MTLWRAIVGLCMLAGTVVPAVAQQPAQVAGSDDLPAACAIDSLPMRLPDDRAPLVISAPDGSTTRIAIEIADDPGERSNGLMCRLDLRDDEGMLFIFPDDQQRFFWMRNTPLSLDIAFIDAGGTVLNVAGAVAPLNDDPIASQGPARYVLEVRAGRAVPLGIVPGAQLSHPVLQTSGAQ